METKVMTMCPPPLERVSSQVPAGGADRSLSRAQREPASPVACSPANGDSRCTATPQGPGAERRVAHRAQAGHLATAGAVTGSDQPLAACPLDGASVPEPPCFDWVVETYTADVMRFSLHLTGNRADASDLFQETMLKAQRAFGRLPADASHRPWLLRITNNTFLDERRRQARLIALPPEHEARLPAPGHDLAAALDARDLLAEVEAAIELLPRKQRISLILRKHVEASYEEIGETLRISPTAARANVYQALRKLREQFGDRL